MARSKSSKRWLKEHFDDQWVKKAQQDGWRSRAAFKLLEIQEKDKILKPGMKVIDLGAAPGGWSQVASKILAENGRVIATDILPMDVLEDVEFVQGDFTEEAVLDEILKLIEGEAFDLVISDMAPNMSGMKSVDQPRSMYLAELALDLAVKVLKPNGAFLTKVFQGEGIEEYRAALQSHFKVLKSRKPEASRSRSNEVYLLAQGFKGTN